MRSEMEKDILKVLVTEEELHARSRQMVQKARIGFGSFRVCRFVFSVKQFGKSRSTFSPRDLLICSVV